MRRAVMLCFALPRCACNAVLCDCMWCFAMFMHRPRSLRETQGAPVAPLIATNCLEYGPPIGLIASLRFPSPRILTVALAIWQPTRTMSTGPVDWKPVIRRLGLGTEGFMGYFVYVFSGLLLAGLRCLLRMPFHLTFLLSPNYNV